MTHPSFLPLLRCVKAYFFNIQHDHKVDPLAVSYLLSITSYATPGRNLTSFQWSLRQRPNKQTSYNVTGEVVEFDANPVEGDKEMILIHYFIVQYILHLRTLKAD